MFSLSLPLPLGFQNLLAPKCQHTQQFHLEAVCSQILILPPSGATPDLSPPPCCFGDSLGQIQRCSLVLCMAARFVLACCHQDASAPPVLSHPITSGFLSRLRCFPCSPSSPPLPLPVFLVNIISPPLQSSCWLRVTGACGVLNRQIHRTAVLKETSKAPDSPYASQQEPSQTVQSVLTEPLCTRYCSRPGEYSTVNGIVGFPCLCSILSSST